MLALANRFSQPGKFDFILWAQQAKGKVIYAYSNSATVFHPGPCMSIMKIVISCYIEARSLIINRLLDTGHVTRVLDHFVIGALDTVVVVSTHLIVNPATEHVSAF
jgi:hypothetical protein